MNTRGIWLLEIVVRMMDMLIDNPQTLNIASRGFCRYILPLLLLVQTILFPIRNGSTNNLITTRNAAGGQKSLKFEVKTMYKPKLVIASVRTYLDAY